MSSAPGPIPNPVFSTFAFLGFLACVVPFPWHLEAWNTGTCLYMFWTGLGCLNMFVNSIVWNGNAINWAPVWCDISSRIILGTHFAIPAASLCINRRLYRIASIQAVTVSRAEKRRAVMVDLAIGLGYPCLMIALQYIVQGHRFNIFEEIGCFPFTYNTPPAFVLVHAQPLFVGLISLVYCALSIRLFAQKHVQYTSFLSSQNSLTKSRYVRLILLAGLEIVTNIPLASWALANNVRAGVAPWLGWNDTHYGFSRVDLFPAMFWRKIPGNAAGLEFTRWAPIVCAAVFFAFFGFADEARKNYRSAVETVARKMGYSTFTLTGSRTGTSSTSTLNGGLSSTGKTRTAPRIFVQTDRLTDASVCFDDASEDFDEKEKGFFATDAASAADSHGDASSSSSPPSSPEPTRQPSRNSIHSESPKVSERSPV
ncbi:STE3-domain-containing protein [Coprinellus micaceus]|uniref:STE3-domain-containing protein n=1 Tax=Coprinellus micaceus TaxID=71717 RepID=A0A4Y7T3K0_COPMI|nr:STE3-domain-containing protein [Coprinellus micaceus]